MTDTATRHRSPGWTRLLFGTTSSGSGLDVALLGVRIALAWIFIYYGAAKLFGAFPGGGPHGIHQTALFMSKTAHLRPGKFFAVVGGLIEFGGGLAMALGLCTRLAGLALFGDMVMATITVSWATGINSTTNPPGYQLNLAVAALAVVTALAGAGRFSADALIARTVDQRRPGVSSKGDAADTRPV
jgi:putative oxidoreductase